MLTSNFQHELKRKIFHSASLIFPISYHFIHPQNMVIILLSVTIFTITIDIFRHYNKKIQEVVNKILGIFMRPNEISGSYNLSGSSFMALGFLMSCLFFEKSIAITSWYILIISDSLAALIGIKFGKTLKNHKSFAGSFAFFISSLIIIALILPNTNLIKMLVAATSVTLVEFFSKTIKINDNLSIPLTFGIMFIIVT